MKKVDTEKIKEEMSFYDFDGVECKKGGEIVVEYIENDIVTFSDIYYGGSPQKYRQYSLTIGEFILCLFGEMREEKCIVVNYSDKWVNNNKLSGELQKLLGRFETEKMILIDKEGLAVNLFIESILKYNSFVSFVFPCERVVVTPTDHLDVFICAENTINIKEKIKSILRYRAFSGLQYLVMQH